ncbi:lytic polysaccharide monooxygenase [Actinoplanes sp. NPDC051346]|uniref:lytic polysaccharide monooxygenase auxiliary activity family 9 protein n=1 Tax=Actinoplanes sp. NPDC051346 TaxID=3155048 RepID=UPI003426BBC6
MSSTRRIAALAVAGGIAAATSLLPAVPALAHGAPTTPVSRTAACAAGGDRADSAACRAARDANGRPFGRFDNLRVPNVAGRDRQVIPDGRLCSGNLPDFRGLDLPRDDWAATKVTAGSTLKVAYATTIPHQGSFRLYLTDRDYDPAKTLRWDDLGSPLAEVKDPPLREGAYRMSVKLPENRAGRHVLFTVWETSSTPDTYYSCSDLVIKAAPAAEVPAAPAAAPAKPAKKATPKPSRSAEPGAVAAPVDAASAAAPPARESWLRPAAAESEDRVQLGHQIIIAALIVIAGVAAGTGAMRLRTRARRGDQPPA